MKTSVKFITIAFLCVIGIWFFSAVMTGSQIVANKQLNSIENRVAEDAIQQYQIAKRQGNKMQTYVQCSLVAAAYLQAKDEPNYNIWKNREDSLARKLHMNVTN